jgi:hypothetical protein
LSVLDSKLFPVFPRFCKLLLVLSAG